MTKIQTLGHPSKRTWFTYGGSVNKGTTLVQQSGKPFISTELYKSALKTFSGRSVPGGFNMTDPIPGGFGGWLQENSRSFGRFLTPRHGSFIAAVLVHEGYISNSREGLKVILHFP